MITDRFNSSYIDGRCFVGLTYPFSCHDALLIENLRVDEFVCYINKKQVKKAYIQGFSDFSFIAKCSSLEHIALELRLPFEDYSRLRNTSKFEYDLSPIESLSSLLSIDIRENERAGFTAMAKINIEKLPLLQQYSGNYRLTKNLATGHALKSLRLVHFNAQNLQELSNLENLDSIYLANSKIQSLKGCDSLPKLQCLYLHNNRNLQDISDLVYLSKSLKALRIENCSRISDFSALNALCNIELLELSGKNVIPSLSFINNMPQLKTFVFSFNVLDGDLSLCDNLSWVYSEHNKRHYNRKDEDLPKIRFVHGNEGIEEWRRLE